jgi:ENTS family enterobactin (siderophore) exporter
VIGEGEPPTGAASGLRRLLLDVSPLRESPAYRRLWAGLSLAQIGQTLALVAIGLQVYDLTRSSFAVGLVGAFALVPLVVLGLAGGAIVDAHDRRRVALIASLALWATSVVTALQAWLGLRSVPLLYALVACQSAAFAVNNPARAAIVPRLLRRELLPAANALTTLSFTLGASVGPALGGVVVGEFGVRTAYTIDAVTYLFAVWGVRGLPALPPEPGSLTRVGLRAVVDGLRFLGGRPNLRMTFLVDLSAMIFALPRALFPAIGVVVLGGGATTAGALLSAVAVGSMLAGLLSGPLGGVRRQGLAIVACVALWGLAIAAFGGCVLAAGAGRPPAASGVSDWLWPALGCLLVAGAADAVSAVFRQTILQAATPDAMRGRLQGVFIVVVAGGPRLGDLVSGTAGDLLGEGTAALAGGLACVAAVLALARLQRRFLRYDAAHPEP